MVAIINLNFMSSDIHLYNLHPEKYSELQNLRPDYKSAIDVTVSLAIKHLKNRNEISVADFCGGIGNVTKKIAENMPVSKASIIDINKEFLNIAELSGIKVKELETINSDILNVKLKKDFDLILSVFSYHHVTDDKKEKYLEIALNGLREDGFLILTEIYLPDQDITKQYYRKLLDEIPTKNSLLENFLTETANSTSFEYKVSKEFAARQLEMLGFKEIESVKIWPLDNTFDENIGTFVQVFRK